MRSAEVCQCAGRYDLPGTRRKTSTLSAAGSPCSTDRAQPAGRNAGQAPQFNCGASASRTSAGSAGGGCAIAGRTGKSSDKAQTSKGNRDAGKPETVPDMVVLLCPAVPCRESLHESSPDSTSVDPQRAE